MKVFESVQEFITSLEEKDFYKYLLGLLAATFILVGTLLIYHQRRISIWTKQINTINDYRTTIKSIIDRDEQVIKQREEVDRMLEENPDFRIEGTFEELVNKMGLTKNLTKRAVFPTDHGDPEYREIDLDAHLDSMNMKQLTELLDELEQNKRVYIKQLEIQKSKKIPNAIDVGLIIATQQKKPETELTE